MLLGNLKLALGLDTSYKAIVTSSAFVLLCYFYVYSIASYLKIPIVVFQNGFTYNAVFENTYLIDKNWDLIFTFGLSVVWFFLSIRNKKIGIITSLIFTGLAITIGLTGFSVYLHLIIFTTFPFIVSLLILNKIAKGKNILNNDSNLLIINYFSIIIIISSFIGIFLSSSILLFSIPPSSIPIHNYTYPPYVLFSNLAPVLILFLMFSLFINILLRKSILHSLFIKFKEYGILVPLAIGNAQLSTRKKFSFLVVIITLSIALFLIPHNSTVNETNQLIGVDIDEYIRWETMLINTTSVDDLINKTFVIIASGDRPITLLFLLLIIEVTTIDDPSVIEYFPMVLLPFFILTVFFLTKELFSNDTTALISAFLSGVSFHLLIGMYAGLYANWLALIVGYLAIMLFFKYLKGSNQIVGIFFFISIIALMFTHVYTWVIITVVLILFSIYTLKVDNSNKKRLFSLLSLIAISILLEAFRIYVIGTSSGIQQINVVNKGIDLEPFYRSWENLTFATLIYVGGIFSNFIIYGLVIYWSFRSDLKKSSNVFLFIFLSLMLVPFFIGDEMIQARTFYDIPLQIPAAIALTQLMKTYQGKMMAFSLCMWILFVAVRTLFHLYVISPK